MNNRITTDKLKQTAKPIGGAIAKINSHLKHVVEVTPESFLEMVTQPNGYSFTPAIFNGTRSNKNWKEQSVFALDYDSGVTPEEVVSAFENIGITPNVFYSSFSDTPEHRKFRMVFFLNKVITDKEDRDYIQKGLMAVVECDKACKDAARLYFGGIEGEVLNPEPIDYHRLHIGITPAIITKDGNRVRGTKPLPYVSSGGGGRNLVQKDAIIYNNNNTHTNQKEGRIQFDLYANKDEITVLANLIKGEWLEHMELFGLATNLRPFKGGLGLMKKAVAKWNAAGKTH